MIELCPVCGSYTTETVEIDSGDSHRDVWRKPPHSLLATYVRVCVPPEQAAAAKRDATQSLVAHCHTASDLQSDGQSPPFNP